MYMCTVEALRIYKALRSIDGVDVFLYVQALRLCLGRTAHRGVEIICSLHALRTYTVRAVYRVNRGIAVLYRH